ncbi:MAG TPA: response regulator transcription factor [Thermodesulfovibrionales bacterium]|nr:response regulator transcription factor [Thermodesulfovibrionales bacterium]
MIRVLIADDHTMVRKGLKELIEESPGIRVAAEAGDGQEVMAALMKSDINVVLLDIAMPGKSGLEVLMDVKVRNPDLPVLVLSMYPEERYAIRALRAGASGYLSKSSASEELILAINKVARGGKYISPTVAEVLALQVEDGYTRPFHDSLSDREYQVFCKMASGMSPTEIARNLSLSPKTISTYRNRVLQKLKINSNAELIKYAMENELIG